MAWTRVPNKYGGNKYFSKWRTLIEVLKICFINIGSIITICFFIHPRLRYLTDFALPHNCLFGVLVCLIDLTIFLVIWVFLISRNFSDKSIHIEEVCVFLGSSFGFTRIPWSSTSYVLLVLFEWEPWSKVCLKLGSYGPYVHDLAWSRSIKHIIIKLTMTPIFYISKI